MLTEERAESGQRVPKARRRRWRIVTIGFVLALVAAAGATASRYVLRTRPEAQSVETALGRFRAAPEPPPPENMRHRYPAAGVYELRGRGSERISFPPNSQADGAVMPATVTYLAGGCWLWHLDYNVAHWEEYRFCPTATELALGGNGNSQTWDFGISKVKNVATFSCASPAVVLPDGPQAGLTWRRTCTGANTALSGRTTATTTTRIVGVEPLDVGRTRVSSVHRVEETSLSGAQTGSAIAEWWSAGATGLPLKMQRDIRIQSSSPLGGTITYTESGQWSMASLAPRT